MYSTGHTSRKDRMEGLLRAAFSFLAPGCILVYSEPLYSFKLIDFHIFLKVRHIFKWRSATIFFIHIVFHYHSNFLPLRIMSHFQLLLWACSFFPVLSEPVITAHPICRQNGDQDGWNTVVSVSEYLSWVEALSWGPFATANSNWLKSSNKSTHIYHWAKCGT